MEENHLNKKDSVSKNIHSNDLLGFGDNGNIFTPNEMRLKEISAKIQKDIEKIENTYKYNLENINEQKEKLEIYLKAIDSDEKYIDIEETEDERGLNGKANKNIYQNLKPPVIKPHPDEGNYLYGVNNSEQMTEYLESKLDILQTFRKRKFNEYFKAKAEDKANLKKKENPLFESKKVNEIMNKNALKIEKQLLNLFQLEETSDESDDDDITMKKIKLNGENAASVKQVGYKISDFLKIAKYKLNPMKLPFFSNLFDDAAEAVLAFQQKEAGLKSLKAQKGESGLTDESGSLIPKKMAKPEIPMFFDDMKKKTLTEKEKEAARSKYNAMSKAEQEKYEEKLLKKQWQNVVRGVIRIYRFTQKFKMDVEQNCKKFAILCAKEVKKKEAKSQRTARDFVFRAKRMHREMVVYWRKREKELNELKKKKEKLEAEIRKREEEERENLLQRKRLEFLMRQSDLYAHFMARKLGMHTEEKTESKDGVVEDRSQDKAPPPPIDRPEIDEEAALKSIQGMINEQRENLRQFDEETQRQRIEQGGPVGETSKLEKCDVQELIEAQNFDFSSVNLDPNLKIVNPPKSFNGTLKEYQLKGLRWLDNLFEQGINGILADEMGLGKTIQAIALLAHISENKGNWGPFLVVAPASTLFNWQQEISRFAPNLRILPYWGSLKERKTIRKLFQQKLWGTPNSQFHVVITSYQLVVADEKAFQRMKWQYMILDEAQAIKNINSQRWKILLSFNTRNKLLLTGTPIQNTMAELWALLHFIMPKLFDSHEQFQEWFSKDIEAHSQDQKALNQHQLSRLHAILKPFMLRRVKKDVENEIGQKKEFQVLCEMTKRQSELYNSLKKHLSIKEFFQMFESKAKVENLMNLVMQFRKVCNHPELFERRQCKTPFSFITYYPYTGHLPVPFGQIKEVRPENRNPITYELPKLVFDELYSEFDGRDFRHRSSLIRKYFSLWDSHRIHESLFGPAREKKIVHNYNIYSFSRFTNLTPNLVELAMKYDQFYTILIFLHYLKTLGRLNTAYETLTLEEPRLKTRNMFWIEKNIVNYFNSDEAQYKSFLKSSQDIKNFLPYRPAVIRAYVAKAICTPIDVFCSSSEFTALNNYQRKPRVLYTLFNGSDFINGYTHFSKTEDIPRLGLSAIPIAKKYLSKPYLTYEHYRKGIFERDPDDNLSQIEIPSFESLIADSCKLQYLNKLLPQLKKEGHRVLIFCQMTKMMDILEEFLSRKMYSYFRLDGSCTVADRRDMVREFQENPKIFAFILSTRAGGLGVTLTAADVVIFYDNDWNPTMDAQATDRAHRIGQTKDVYVYRLIVKGTIEEKIVKRAQQKQTVQATVYSGGAFKADFSKPSDVMELLFDEGEYDANEAPKFMPKGGARKKGGSKKEKKEETPKKGTRRSQRGENKKNEGMDIEKGSTGGADKDQKEDMDFDLTSMMMKDDDGDDE